MCVATYRRPTVHYLLCAMLALITLPLSAWSQSFTIIDLGASPAGGSSHAYGINNYVHIVGTTGDSTFLAFSWVNGTMTELPTLGGPTSSAYALNDADQIVGFSEDTLGTAHAMLWTPPAGVQDLGTLNSRSAIAFAIDGSGQAVGLDTDATVSDALLWDAVKGIQNLGKIGGSFAEARSINNKGVIVGGTDVAPNSTYHAFRWDVSSGMIDLGVSSTTFPLSEAMAINNANHITGYVDDLQGRTLGFIWDPVHGMRLLGTLGVASVLPLAINIKDKIVGIAKVPGGDNRAFLYSSGSMIDLNTVLPAGSGWQLISAEGINKWSQIVGFGICPQGQHHAYLLTPTVRLTGLVIKPATVSGGQSATATIMVNVPEPVDQAVTISSSSSVAQVPSTVIIPAGSTSTSFPISTVSVTTVQTVRIVVTNGVSRKSAILTVNPG